MSRRMTVGAAGMFAFMAAAAFARESAPAPASAPTFPNLVAALSNMVRLAEQKHVTLAPDSADAVVRGLLQSLDPNAAILDAKGVQDIQNRQKGVRIGVGLKLGLKDKWPVIDAVLPGSPADAAGLKAGDRVEAIGGERQEGRTLAEVTAALEGEKGASVALGLRGAEKDAEPRTVTLQRGPVQLPAIAAQETWLGTMVYVRLNGLFQGAGQAVEEALRSRVTTNTAGFILDLRQAGGADLVAVADIASAFAAEGAVLFRITDGQGRESAVYKAREAKPLGLPTMVLTDAETSGAAETLAAVLREFRGVVLIGSPTRGDDRLREFIPLDDGRFLYLATTCVDLGQTASYRGPGVKPDILVSPESAEKEAAAYALEETSGGNGVIVNLGRKGELSDREKQDQALRQHLRGDAVLKRAVDMVVGLQALSIRVH